MPERRRATNLTGFFGYLPLFWLGALRDAADEFTPRSGHYWGRLLKSVRIPDELETEALGILAGLDARIVAADPRLSQIADQIGQATRVAVGEGPGEADELVALIQCLGDLKRLLGTEAEKPIGVPL